MRHSVARFVAVLVLAAPLPLAAQGADGGPQPISLADAVSQAQASSPYTVQAKGATRVASANVKSAFAEFLPSLSVGQSASRYSGATYFQGQLVPLTGNPWNFGKGYQASLSIFDGGARLLQYRAARADLAAAHQNEVIQRYTIALNVKQQYFAVLEAREAEAAAEQQLKEANEQMAVTVAKIAGGSVPRTDSLTSAVAVGTAKLALITAQGQLVTANTALTRLVGGNREVTAIAADTGLVPTISVDSTTLVRLALEGPSVQQATQVERANRSSWWASLTAYLPTLTVSYSSTNSFTGRQFVVGGGSKLNSSSNQFLSYSLSYSIFNNFRREASVIQNSAASDNAKAGVRDARLAARENLAQYLAQFRTAEATIELQQLQIEAAEQSVAAKDAQYRAGAVPLVDVLTQQTALATARQNLIQARMTARTAKAQIEAIIGKDLE
jgi:outer membrane protein